MRWYIKYQVNMEYISLHSRFLQFTYKLLKKQQIVLLCLKIYSIEPFKNLNRTNFLVYLKTWGNPEWAKCLF